MKKIIVLSNGISILPNTLDYAIDLSKKAKATLYLLIVSSLKSRDDNSYIFPSDINATDVDYTIETDAEEILKLEDAEIELFKNLCVSNDVDFSVSRIHTNFLDGIVDHSVFADLIICDEKSDERKFSLNGLMSSVHCPVLVLPSNALPFTEILLTFDEQSSSMHAIRQFTYLFSSWRSLPAYLVSVLPENVIGLEYRELLDDWLKHYYSNVSIEILKGRTKDELPSFINEHKNAVVVMGSFKRSSLSRLFKDSLANTVLEKTKSAVFIAHD
jgi:nucleotide-binding universal stress UspA family protein